MGGFLRVAVDVAQVRRVMARKSHVRGRLVVPDFTLDSREPRTFGLLARTGHHTTVSVPVEVHPREVTVKGEAGAP